jgi:hypothetical protein
VERVAFDGSQPSRPVGHYTYIVADGSWTWSEGVYAMHGYAPREVPATTEVLLHHKHPDDRDRTFAVLESAVANGEPFSCYHRVIDRNQRVRSVLSVGRGVKDAQGKVERVEGYFVDLTEVRRDETQAEVDLALARIAQNRAVIDQAKGMLMLATGDTRTRPSRGCATTRSTPTSSCTTSLVASSRPSAPARAAKGSSLSWRASRPSQG